MKFKRLTLTNFMRYKGTNTIEFSCDEERNVTVVMGDNTFGKTTLAQAFRWGLYGEIIDTRYAKSKDIILLNKDVLSEMGGHNEETVSVEIEVIENNIVYVFKREAEYLRKYPQMAVKQINEKLYLRKKIENQNWEDWIDNDGGIKYSKNYVNEQISIMFPKELSNYFFFDGERWNDEKKTNQEIKNSIGTLMGITPLVKMKEHLKNGNALSVIKTLEGRISGSGTKFDDIRRSIDRIEKDIDRWNEEIEQAQNDRNVYQKKVDDIVELLESNSKVEQLTNECKRLNVSIERNQKQAENTYVELVKMFSKDAYKYFATPLLEDVVRMLKNIDLDGKDIPDLSANTLDYLINHGKCICGNDITEKEINYMNELKNYIWPNTIGRYVGQYQDKLQEWKVDTVDFVEIIHDKALMVEGYISQVDEETEAKEKIENKIDNRFNFAKQRSLLQSYKNSLRTAEEKIRKNENNIKDYTVNLNRLKTELEKETDHTEQNRKIMRMIAYANRLYERTNELLQDRQEPLMNELNEIIKKKFEEMFHEKEKFAQMEDDYKLHLYYKKMGEDDLVEELSLSEGEIIARNFVFIVSILELAQIKKKEDVENNIESDVINLPLVLDGPFSKLGDVNTSLIANVLPNVAEQVIVFMLDKDWDASGLEKYTLPEYRFYVSKEAEDNSAKIARRN